VKARNKIMDPFAARHFERLSGESDRIAFEVGRLSDLHLVAGSTRGGRITRALLQLLIELRGRSETIA
jgi:hypothetical protein